MLEALIGIAGFLGGGFLTAIGFILTNSNNIAVMQTDISQLKKDVKEIKDRPTVMCSAHLEVDHRITKLEAKEG